jgi:ketosteroid isomerase-like protein
MEVQESDVMTDFDDLAKAIDRYHVALDAFFNGDPGPGKATFSHRDDVSLANPFGPPAVGWRQVAETMARAAANYRDGGATGFERLTAYATPGLAYIVEIEHYETKVGGRDDISRVELRVTTILRPEDAGWKVVHRHADPITTSQPAESVIQG